MEASSELIVLTVSPQGLNEKRKTVGTTKDRLRGPKGRNGTQQVTLSSCVWDQSWSLKMRADQGLWSPLGCQTALERDSRPRERERLYAQQSFLVEVLCQKQNETSGRKSSCTGKKKIRGGSKVRVQQGEPNMLLGWSPVCKGFRWPPLIACRCNNMDWSSVGAGGPEAYREDISTSLSSGKQQLSCGLQCVQVIPGSSAR